MPARFVLTSPSTNEHQGHAVVVNRNEIGVLWLRAAGNGGRAWLAEHAGGSATSDEDVLRAAALVIASIGEAKLPAVEA